jgi:hypothetical protein
MTHMSKPCILCRSPDRAIIERQVSKGMSYREAGRIVGCDHHVIERHFTNHVAPELRKKLEAREPADLIDVVDELVAAHRRTLTLIAKAYQDGDIKTCFTGQQTQLKQLEFYAKLVGMTDERAEINLYMSEPFLQLQELVVTSLADYPEARLRLGDALARAAGAGSNPDQDIDDEVDDV